MELLLDGNAIWLPAVALLGISVGFVAGMFGVGGGFLLVPLMHVALGVPLRFAVGAALCQTIATSLGSFLRYRKLGHAEGRFDMMLVGGSLLGVDAGTRLLTALEHLGTIEVAGKDLLAVRVVVTAAYAVLFLSLAWLMWARPALPAGAQILPGPLARISLRPVTDLPVAGLRGVSGPFIGVIGFCNGVFAGTLGIGGGILLFPIMLYGFGFDIRKAAGSGIIVVLVVALLGTLQHARLGNVHLGLAATLMIGAAISAQLGTNLTRTLPQHALRKGLAVVMVLTVAAMLLKLLR